MHKQFRITHVCKYSYLHCSFSSRLPRDVIDNARMNSSNSIAPSCNAIDNKDKQQEQEQEQEKEREITRGGEKMKTNRQRWLRMK